MPAFAKGGYCCVPHRDRNRRIKYVNLQLRSLIACHEITLPESAWWIRPCDKSCTHNCCLCKLRSSLLWPFAGNLPCCQKAMSTMRWRNKVLSRGNKITIAEGSHHNFCLFKDRKASSSFPGSCAITPPIGADVVMRDSNGCPTSLVPGRCTPLYPCIHRTFNPEVSKLSGCHRAPGMIEPVMLLVLSRNLIS